MGRGKRNRNNKRKIEGRKGTQTSAPPPFMSTERTTPAKIRKCLSWGYHFIVYIFSFIGLVASWYGINSNISVAPLPYIDKSDSFSVPFEISHNGGPEIEHLAVDCAVQWAKTKTQDVRGVIIKGRHDAASLSSGHSTTTYCNLTGAIYLGQQTSSARIRLLVSYRSWYWGFLPDTWRIVRQEFIYDLLRTREGEPLWVPRA